MSQLAAVPPAGSDTATNARDTRLQGRWLLVARLGWILLTVLILTLNVVMIPRYAAVLQAPCQPGAQCVGIQLTAYDRQILHQMGVSLGFVAGYQVMLDTVAVLVYCALGALLFWRQSADRMALFCAFMLVLFGGASFTSILQDTLWLASPAWFVVLGILDLLGQITFLIFFLLFPSGRFAPRWSRWATPVIVLYWLREIFFYNSLSNQNGDTPDNLIFFVLLLGVVAAQVYRYRSVSTPRERQQTKWVVFGFAIGIVGFVLLIGLGTIILPSDWMQSAVIGTFVANTAVYGFLLLIPISIVIAILRSQLYDIDVIINRTIVYGSLTGILGALYAGLIIGLENLVAVLTGGRTTQQPLILVVSTLATAALFQPARHRLQAFIDRRFYRQKYDAQKTLDTFSATLRSEVDLSDLRERLLVVINETMQPAHISLWLRPPEQHSMEPPHHTNPDGSVPTNQAQ